jgi:ligand-binding sensor domain-containing protein/signal transduction histidine kinase
VTLRIYLKINLLAYLTLIGLNLKAQLADFTFEQITTKNDLSQNSVLAMLQDYRGFMWFGTEAGIDRYDGIGFAHFANDPNDSSTIQSGVVNALFEDRINRDLYVGTTSGISKMNLTDHFFKKLKINSLYSNNNVLKITGGRENDIWIATEKEVFFFEKGQFYPVHFNSESNDADFKIFDFVKDPRYEYGIVATNKGMFLLDMKKRKIDYKLYIKGLSKNLIINKLLTRFNELIVATAKDGFFLLNITHEQDSSNISLSLINQLRYDGDRESSKCSAILSDTTGSLWIATERDGLIYFTQSSAEGIKITRKSESLKSLSSNYIRSICKSRDGVIWIGTIENGVNKLTNNNLSIQKYFTSDTNYPGLKSNNDVWCIYQLNDDELLLGSDGNGIIKISLTNRNAMQRYYSAKNAENNVIRVICPMGNKLLVGSSYGLTVLPADRIGQYGNAKKILRGSVLSILVPDSNTYVGTEKEGLIVLDKELHQVQVMFNQDSNTRAINCLMKDNGKNLIYAGTSKGVNVFAVNGYKLALQKTLLNSHNITSLNILGDTIWVGTSGRGLYCFDRNSLEELERFDRYKGLSDNTIYGLLNDNNNRLWISTNKGLSVYDTHAKTFNLYTREDGLQHDEFNLGSFYKGRVDTNEMLFFGGVNGLNSIVSKKAPGKKDSGNIEACLLVYRGKYHEFIPLIHLFDTTRITLDLAQNYLIIDVRVFNYEDPENNRYKYRLNSMPWSEEKNLRESISIPLNSFGDDDNELELIVRSSNGEWHRLPQVTINKPFNLLAWVRRNWRKPAALLFFIIVSAILIGIIRKNSRRKVEEYRDIQELINEISKTGSMDGMINKALLHITSSPLFKFDYGVFSIVDYKERLIQIKDSAFTNEKLIDPAKWREITSTLSLDSEDVMARSVMENTVFKVKGEKVYSLNKGKVLRKEAAILDKQIFEKFDHKSLVRIFVPIRPPGAALENGLPVRVIGLMEVGFHKTTKSKISDDLVAKLGLYSDNVAQTFKAFAEKESARLANAILKEAEKGSGDDPQKYLQIILNKTCETLGVGYGGIALLTLNRPDISKADISLFYPKLQADQKSIVPYYSLTSYETGNVEFSNKAADNRDGVLPAYSTLSAPIRYEGIIIGTLELIGEREDFFDQYNIPFIKEITVSVGEQYISKKFHFAVAKLTSSENLLDLPKTNIANSIDTIKQYFNCDFISFWERDFEKESIEYFQLESTINKNNDGNVYAKKNIQLDEGIPELRPITVLDKINSGYVAPFKTFTNASGIMSIIHVPLRVGDAKYGFINIYSRLKLDEKLFGEDKQFLELLALKSASSYLTSKMISIFSAITQDIADKELDDILQKITDAARMLLHSDPVTLFQYDKDIGGIQYKKTIYSGHLKDEKKGKEGKKARFIESIIIKDEECFAENWESLPEEYRQDYIKSNSKQEYFWWREGIESVAVMVLKEENKVIGVMSFNYRQKQVFSPQIQQLIRTFSALASTAISNIANVSLIKKQSQELKKYSEQVEQEKESIQYEKDNMEVRLMELFPSTNAASLTEIIRAVNHDIRNNLSKIERNMKGIKDESLHIKLPSNRDQLDSNLKLIKDNIENTTSLLSLFGPESFEMSYEELYTVTKKVERLFAGQLGKEAIKVKSELLNQDIPTIRCSRAEISMIIYNLVSNARDAIVEQWKKDGKPGAGPQGMIQIKLNYDRVGKNYIITVEDDGCGIDNNNQDKIFDLGFSTRNDDDNKGLGIGLYFVKNTIEKMYGGTITVKSTVGRGTKFELIFRQHIK